MDTQPNVGAVIPTVLLPRPGIDLTRWAVIACDQFTSEPEYWDQVAEIAGGRLWPLATMVSCKTMD